MKKFLVIILFSLLLYSNRMFSQVEFANSDSVINFLTGRWEWSGRCGGITGNDCTYPESGIQGIIFSRIPNVTDSIYYESFYNKVINGSGKYKIIYTSTIFGDKWLLKTENTQLPGLFDKVLFISSLNKISLSDNHVEGYSDGYNRNTQEQNTYVLETFTPVKNTWLTWVPNLLSISTVDPSNSAETVATFYPSATEQYGLMKAQIQDVAGFNAALSSEKKILKFRMRMDNPKTLNMIFRVRIFAQPTATANDWGNHMYFEFTPTVFGEWAEYSFDLNSQFSETLIYNYISFEPSINDAYNEAVYIDDIVLTVPDPILEMKTAYSSTDGNKIIIHCNYPLVSTSDFSGFTITSDNNPLTINSIEVSETDSSLLLLTLSAPVAENSALVATYTAGTITDINGLSLQPFSKSIANLLHINTVNGWRSDFSAEVFDTLSNTISGLNPPFTSLIETKTGDGVYSVTMNGSTGWNPLLITTYTSLPNGPKQVMDVTGRENVMLRYRITSNSASPTCSLRVDFKDKLQNISSDQMAFIPLAVTSEWTDVGVDLRKTLENAYGPTTGIIDQGTIDQVLIYLVEKQGDAASAYMPKNFNGTIEFDYIEVGAYIPKPQIARIGSGTLRQGETYICEVTDSIQGGLITWYSDAAHTNIVGYGNTLATTIIFKGDNVRYATRTIRQIQSENSLINVSVLCDNILLYSTVIDTIIPFYKKQIVLDALLENTSWMMDGNDVGNGKTFTYNIDKADTVYIINSSSILFPNLFCTSNINTSRYEIIISNELPYVNTFDTIIQLAVGEEKDLLFEINPSMCRDWFTTNIESNSVDTVSLELFNPNNSQIIGANEYSVLTIKGVQEGVDTLQWYRTTSCAADGTIKRFIIKVGNETLVDTCPHIQFSKKIFMACTPETTITPQFDLTLSNMSVFEVPTDTVLITSNVLGLGKNFVSMQVMFMNGCSVTVSDTIFVSQVQPPRAPIVQNTVYAFGEQLSLEAKLGANSIGMWLDVPELLQYYGDGNNSRLFLETENLIGEYEYSVVAIDTITGCLSDTSLAHLKIVMPNTSSVIGTVQVNGNMFTNGTVQLFRKNGTEFEPTAISEISDTGTFEFNYLEPATYIFRAIPTAAFSTTSAIYLPTYYYSTTNWVQANEINLAGNVEGIDINIIEFMPATSGTGSISGTIVSEDVSLDYENLYKALECFKVPVFVVRNNVIVGYGLTDINGNYSIPNLPDGSYDIYVEFPGYSKTTNTVIITEGSNSEVNFTLKNGEVTLNLNSVSESIQMLVYPNPTHNIVSITSEELIESIQIIDVVGKVIKTIVDENTINVSTLNPGVYILKIKTASGISIKDLIKK